MLDQKPRIQSSVFYSPDYQARPGGPVNNRQCRRTIFWQKQRQPSEISASSFD
jgi:hypothetical protein